MLTYKHSLRWNPLMANHLFSYGTLQSREVMKTVTGRTPEGIPATLIGYAAYRVKHAPYPGILPEKGATTRGTLYRGLSEDELTLLDRFEGEFYERKLVEVTGVDGKVRSANTYVVSPHHTGSLTREPWDLESFVKSNLRDFMKTIEPL